MIATSSEKNMYLNKFNQIRFDQNAKINTERTNIKNIFLSLQYTLHIGIHRKSLHDKRTIIVVQTFTMHVCI